MINAYDIFRLRGGNSVIWLESVPTFDRAKERIRDLAAVAPGSYIIVNQETGTKLVVVDPLKTAKHVVIQAGNHPVTR